MKNIDYHLLSRYFAGETSAEEETQIKSWRNSHPEAEHTYKSLKALWELDFDTEYANKHKWKAQEKIERVTLQKSKSGFNYWKVAASIVFVFAVGLFIWQTISNPSVNWQEKITIAGQKSSLTLADGSQIHLNASSRLIYPDRFNDSVRLVKLEGEGYFDIMPSDVPFIVVVQDLEITVLGTSFNIEGDTSSNKIKVAVSSGKVKVSNDRNQLILTPNQMADYDQKSQQLNKSSAVDIDKIIAWKDGWLIFEDEPLQEVAKTLERWYGTEIKLENQSLHRCIFTGRFQNETLINVIDNICYTSNLKYKTDNKTIILYGEGCSE